MMDSIYLVNSGCYSGIETHGYFTTIDEAEKYCAYRNSKMQSEDSYYDEQWDSYWVSKVDKIVADVSSVDLKRYHEVLFNIDRLGSTIPSVTMRDEPDRYSIYIGETKSPSVEYQGYKWIAFHITNDDRSVAEKIAQDMMAKVMEKYCECDDIKFATSIFRQYEK